MVSYPNTYGHVVTVIDNCVRWRKATGKNGDCRSDRADLSFRLQFFNRLSDFTKLKRAPYILGDLGY